MENKGTPQELIIPEFLGQPQIPLPIAKIKEGENRLVEAQVVNPATYSSLEFLFNEGYREARYNLSMIMFQISAAEKAIREARSVALLDEYPEFLKTKGMKDSAAIRDAYLERCEAFVRAQDRIDMLKAMENLMEGKVKVFERVCAYMKVQMNLLIKSGMDINHYVR